MCTFRPHTVGFYQHPFLKKHNADKHSVYGTYATDPNSKHHFFHNTTRK